MISTAPSATLSRTPQGRLPLNPKNPRRSREDPARVLWKIPWRFRRAASPPRHSGRRIEAWSRRCTLLSPPRWNLSRTKSPRLSALPAWNRARSGGKIHPSFGRGPIKRTRRPLVRNRRSDTREGKRPASPWHGTAGRCASKTRPTDLTQGRPAAAIRIRGDCTTLPRAWTAKSKNGRLTPSTGQPAAQRGTTPTLAQRVHPDQRNASMMKK
jgi:hypothetical protein